MDTIFINSENSKTSDPHSLLGNLLTGKGTIRTGEGATAASQGQGTVRAGQDF